MFNCPFCGADYTDLGLRDGRCPHCGGVINWEHNSPEAEAAPPQPPQVEPQPPGSPPADSAPAADAAPPEQVADGGTRILDPNRRSIDIRELSPEEAQRVSMLWKNTIRPGNDPRMTLKPESTLVDTKSSLVISRRSMRRHEDIKDVEMSAEYELLDVIGQGGMGVVYAARQASIDRTVAIKMLHTTYDADEDNRHKFLAEAVVTGELEHPNIVPIYDLGANDSGALFYSMKRVRGTPWNEVVRYKSQVENLEILMKVCDAVAFSHARGVVHRDLKPENVMLGDFGEVLVMDWGIALSTSEEPRPGGILQSNSMGGTPAYMAPEMATGPLEQIGPASDVYLLGAILFEIISGRPPHEGATITDCLLSAAQNVIAPTNKTGELLEISYRAMATQPSERFDSVQDFQKALRQYQSHSESIALANQGEQHLEEAVSKTDYQEFSRALFAYEQAVSMWRGNHAARAGLNHTRVVYADAALTKGDYDLGLSLLDEQNNEHTALIGKLKSAQQEREARQQRLRSARRVVMGLGALVFITVTTFLCVSVYQYQRQRQLNNDLFAEKKKAEGSAKKARDAARDALTEKANAEAARQVAVSAKTAAEESQERALQAQQEEQYRSYLARMRLVAPKLAENAFDEVSQILTSVEESPLRHWEWGRYRHLLRLSTETHDAAAPVNVVRISPDGRWLLAGDQAGKLHLWDRSDDQPLRSLQVAGSQISSAAFAPDSSQIVTTSYDTRDTGSFIEAWHTSTGEPAGRYESARGHRDWINDVRFSPDGTLLLTSSYDQTAKLWDTQSKDVVHTLVGHHQPVWQSEFSADQNYVVTASEDGTAMVWRKGSDGWDSAGKFSGHEGPVYCLAFSPDGRHVATGGYDKRILVWQFQDIKPFPYAEILSQLERESDEELQTVSALNADVEPPFIRLDGHASAVRSLDFSLGSGRRLVSAGDDNLLIVWDLETTRAEQQLRGHSRSVRSCVFSKQASEAGLVASGALDGQIKTWQLSEYEEVRVVEATMLQGHEGAILSARFSPGGDRLVTSSEDRTVRVWPFDPQQRGADPVAMVLSEGHAYLTSTAKFFRVDGEGTPLRLITAALDDSARIWDVRNGGQVLTLMGTGQAAVLDVSRDGHWVITGSAQQAARLWDLRAADELPQRQIDQPTLTLAGHDGNVSAVALMRHVDGRLRTLSGDENGLCLLHAVDDRQDPPQVELLHRWIAHADQIAAARFMPQDADQLLTAGLDNSIRMWQLDSTVPTESFRLGESDGVIGLAVSERGEHAAHCRVDGAAFVWDLATRTKQALSTVGDQRILAANLRRQINRRPDWDLAQVAQLSGLTLEQLQRVLQGVTNPPNDVVEALSKTLDVSVAMLRQPMINAVDIGADGTIMTASSQEQTVRLWSLDGRAIERQEQPAELNLRSKSLTLWTATLHPDGSILTLGNRQARLWSKQGVERMSFGAQGVISAASFSPDGKRVAAASWDNSVRIWKVAEGIVERKLSGVHTRAVNSAVFSPDGRWVLTAGDDGRAVLWDASTGEPSTEAFGGLLQHDAPLTMAVFSPNAQAVVAASQDGGVLIWNVQDGADDPLKLAGHQGPVRCVTVSRDGQWLASGGDDDVAIVWSARTGRQLAILRGHTGRITAVGFSPDRRRILTGSHDASAKLWDTRDLWAQAEHNEGAPIVFPTEILTLSGHQREVTSASFSTDGRFILTASRDGRALVWLAEPVPPNMGFSSDSVTCTALNQPTLIDSQARFQAPTTIDFSGAIFTATLVGDEEDAWQRLLIDTQSELSSGRQLQIEGDQLSYRTGEQDDWTEIATIQQSEPQRLVVRFNAAADALSIETVIRAIAYQCQRLPVDRELTRKIQLIITLPGAAPLRGTRTIDLSPLAEAAVAKAA